VRPGVLVLGSPLTVLRPIALLALCAACDRGETAHSRQGRASWPQREHRTPDGGSSQASGCSVDSLASTASLAALSEVKARAQRPDLGNDRATRATGLSLSTDRGQRIVATLSWGGPNGGALVLLSCGGELLGFVDIGYVTEMNPLDATGDGRQEVTVRHTTGTGTGWREEQTAVFAFSSDSIRVLWSGITFQGAYQSEELGGTWELRAEVIFPSPGRLIRQGYRTRVEYDQYSRGWRPVGVPARFRDELVWDRRLATFRPVMAG